MKGKPNRFCFRIFFGIPGLLGMALCMNPSWVRAQDEDLQICSPPQSLPLILKRVIRRSSLAFTEGLFFWRNALYESSGLYGQSSLQRIDPSSGESVLLGRIPQDQFGEGLAKWGDEFIQLTWTQNIVWLWPITQSGQIGLTPGNTFYFQEGWGLASGPSEKEGLIASDGSSRLYFLDPERFTALRTLEVRDQFGPVKALNELEIVDDPSVSQSWQIWANIWPTYRIVRIDPISGCVTGQMDLSGLKDELALSDRARIEADPDAIPNGIAYDPGGESLYLTAKMWPIFFEAFLPN